MSVSRTLSNTTLLGATQSRQPSAATNADDRLELKVAGTGAEVTGFYCTQKVPEMKKNIQ